MRYLDWLSDFFDQIDNILVTKAPIIRYFKLSGLKQKKFILSVLEARHPKSRCLEDKFLLAILRQNLFHAFLLGPNGHQQSLSFLDSQPHHFNLCLITTWYSSCMSPCPDSPPLISTPFLGSGTTLIQYDLIST